MFLNTYVVLVQKRYLGYFVTIFPQYVQYKLLCLSVVQKLNFY